MNDRRLPNQLPQIHGEDLDVSCWDATMLLLARITNAWPIIQSISNHAQIGQQLTITEIMTNQAFRASIDQTIDPELVELVAHDLNSNPDDITKAMVQLSLDTTTLPNHTRETINQYLHAWLETHQEQEQLAGPETINEDDCQIPILSMMLHDPRFIERIGEDRFRDAGHYYQILTDGETAQADLSQANLRLVVSIAKKHLGTRPQHAGPGPGRQPGAHALRGQVRLPPRLQVQHLRHLVDSAGHHPRHRRASSHHPGPRCT